MFFNVEEGLDQSGEELVAPPPPPRVLDDVAERRSEGFDPVVNRSSVRIRKYDAMVCAEGELMTGELTGPTAHVLK